MLTLLICYTIFNSHIEMDEAQRTRVQTIGKPVSDSLERVICRNGLVVTAIKLLGCILIICRLPKHKFMHGVLPLEIITT